MPLKKLMSVDQSLVFEPRDVETAVEMYFKDKQEKRSQSQICAEAKKIIQLLSGFRRILRMKYDVDKTLMNFMELNEDHGTEAHPFLAKFGMLRDVESDESLVSMPSEEAESATLERGTVPVTRRRQCNQERGNAAKHQKLHDNEDESAEDASSVDTQGMHKESEDESETLERESMQEFVIKQDWAVRWEDDLPAESVTQAKDGKAVFHWVDGDIYYSQEVLYTEAIASRQARTLSNKHRDTIQEARKACEHHGDFKVSVLPRPKLSNGGWEVVLKTNKNKQQIWSITSCHSKPVADSLLGTIKWANRLAHAKSEKAKVVEGLCDESKGKVEKIGKANKGKKSSPPEKKVDKYKKDEVTQETVTEGGSMSHEQLTPEKTSAKEAKTKRKKRKTTKLG